MSQSFIRRLCASFLSLGFFSTALSPVFVFAQQAEIPAGGRIIPNAYIVTLKDAQVPDVATLVQEYRLTSDPTVFRNALKGFAATLSDTQVKALASDPRIAAIEPDVEVVAFGTSSYRDTVRGSRSARDVIDEIRRSWGRKKPEPEPSPEPAPTPAPTPILDLPTGINRVDAELSVTANINGTDDRVDIDVAVIDTGVQKKHPDLNVFRQVKFTSESSLDDKNGHGTHVAGIIGALDNNKGVVGVAPGARIWSVKVLGSNGSGRMSDIIAGLDYVTANASSIEVANMSLGCECTSTALNTAISKAVSAGVTIVVAAGNAAKDSSTYSPASHPDVITVSAIADFNGAAGGGTAATCYNDIDDTFAAFSNYGAPVDIAAPGVCINSTWKGSGYKVLNGTSMASPHVAGAAALYIAKNGKPTNAIDVAGIRSDLISAGWSQSSSGGFTGDPDGSAEPVLNASSF